MTRKNEPQPPDMSWICSSSGLMLFWMSRVMRATLGSDSAAVSHVANIRCGIEKDEEGNEERRKKEGVDVRGMKREVLTAEEMLAVKRRRIPESTHLFNIVLWRRTPHPKKKKQEQPLGV